MIDCELQPQEFTARNGFSLSYKGKTLLSRIDPIAQAERIVNSIPVKERTLYVCPSPLYGYGLETLVKKLGDESAVLCIEADEKLFSLSCKHMAELLCKDKDSLRMVNVSAGKGDALCAFANNSWGARRFRRVEVLQLNGGWQLFPGLYEGLVSDLRRDMAVSWGNAMTLIRLGRLYCRNLIRNLPLIGEFEPVSALNYGNDPVLVLGAGPSLDGILNGLQNHWGNRINENEERPFRIICADTCIPPLKDRGIKPDLVVILESQHWNLRDFTGAKNWGVPAAIDLSCLPASARVLGGKAYLFMTPWTNLKLFKRMEQRSLLPPALTPLGSVGLSAMELASRLTKGPIISGGIDFSFTMDAYHARSTPGHKTRMASLSRLRSPLNAHEAFREGTFSAVSKMGVPVRSDPAMRGYRQLFEEEFGNKKRIYEFASSGLHLGCKILSIDEANEILSMGTIPGKQPLAPSSTGINESLMKNLESFSDLEDFILEEKEKIAQLKNTLVEGTELEGGIEQALDSLDYLWAHFPECAGAGGIRPPADSLSFLKRVRAEIDPFIKLWDFALRGIQKKN